MLPMDQAAGSARGRRTSGRGAASGGDLGSGGCVGVSDPADVSQRLP
jgi:hypothetical protein